MAEASVNVMIESIEVLLKAGATSALPTIVCSGSATAPLIDRLPNNWPTVVAGHGAFAASVSAALAKTTVVAFPPWGRSDGDRTPQEVGALTGVQPGPPGNSLLLLLPRSVLTSHTAKPLRDLFFNEWRIRAIVSGNAGLSNVSSNFAHSLVLLDSPLADAGVVRMFDSTDTGSTEPSVVDDLRRLMRMSGGTSDFGFIIREELSPDLPLDSKRYDPRLVKRRRELVNFGDVKTIDDIFEVIAGGSRRKEDRRTESVPADTNGAVRIINGRDVSRNNEVVPIDEDSLHLVTDTHPTLRAGDVVLRAIQTSNAKTPGLVWARVTEADLPAAAGPQVLILRPKNSAPNDEISFALRYLSSAAALSLAEDAQLLNSIIRIAARMLAKLQVPVPDAALKTALTSIEQARARAGAWTAEADQIMNDMFSYESAAEARQLILERSRLLRLRMKAVDDIETLDGQVRTQFPLPIAFRWRALEAARSHGDTRDAYLAALDAAEQTLAFVANIGLSLARELEEPVQAVADIASRLRRGQGTSMSDWCNIIDELSGRRYASIDTLISTPELRAFCSDPTVKSARSELLQRRNDEAHGRRVELTDLEHAIATAVDALNTINESLIFLLDCPLIVARRLQWNTFHNQGILDFQMLAGDHSVVPIQQMLIKTPTIETDSLYLLDSKQKLHLVRPFLTGTNCRRCGTFSVFYVDQHRDRKLTLKSLEHGHNIEASEDFVQAATAVGLISAK